MLVLVTISVLVVKLSVNQTVDNRCRKSIVSWAWLYVQFFALHFEEKWNSFMPVSLHRARFFHFIPLTACMAIAMHGVWNSYVSCHEWIHSSYKFWNWILLCIFIPEKVIYLYFIIFNNIQALIIFMQFNSLTPVKRYILEISFASSQIFFTILVLFGKVGSSLI